jgi:CDP-diacylglycerol---serine O-phosphatidyltransferase
VPDHRGPPETYRALRYLAPNLITCASLVFGMVSMIASHQGRWDLAGWMIVYAVLTDRLDGVVARAVRGTSDLGVQLDSFADFLNFGVAPAFLVFTFLDAHPVLDFADGPRRILLIAACVVWVMGAVFRLARYNVTTDDQVPTKIFFGVPTTLAGGLLVTWFLALLKYAGPEISAGSFGGRRLLGEWTTPIGVWQWFPVAMAAGAFLMASSLRMLKVGIHRRRALTVFVTINVFIGYALGFLQLFPEWLVWPPTLWIVIFLVWGQTSEVARGYRPPPLFPRVDDGRIHMRPQQDLAVDDDDDEG